VHPSAHLVGVPNRNLAVDLDGGQAFSGPDAAYVQGCVCSECREHLLISAIHHLDHALKRLPSGPKLLKRLTDQIDLMRHTLEHWDDQQQSKGRWKTLAEKHGEHATPCLAVGGEAGADTDL
jgi:hypothetical protein